ncbi:MAG: DUF302 domain-containing protein [Candidatus Thiodiazotropha sp. (ex Semelilucina semeliformis)]|nr:DUF302 domain-containing protein [Candidatus Thiodiazotropha sp. (ex Semelilucina semeliformis)]
MCLYLEALLKIINDELRRAIGYFSAFVTSSGETILLHRKLHQYLVAGLLMLLGTAALAQSAGTPVKDEQPNPRAMVVERTLNSDYTATLDTLRQQLKDDGWKLIAEIDLGKRLAKKGVDVPGGLVIFKLTSGKNAVPLLAKDETRYVSAMMPCGVSVYGKSDGTVVISRMNFEMMMPMMEPVIAATMEKSINKLNKSIDAAVVRLGGNS